MKTMMIIKQILKTMGRITLGIIILFILYVLVAMKFGTPNYWLPPSKQGDQIKLEDLLITPYDLGSDKWVISEAFGSDPDYQYPEYRQNNLAITLDSISGKFGFRHQIFLNRNKWDSNLKYKELLENYKTIVDDDKAITINFQPLAGDRNAILCEQNLPYYHYYCKIILQVDEFISVITYREGAEVNDIDEINKVMNRLNKLAYSKFIDAGIREK